MLEEILEGLEQQEELAPDALELREQLETYQKKYEDAVQAGHSDAAHVYENQIAQLRGELEGAGMEGPREISFCGSGRDLAQDSKDLRDARREYQQAEKTIRKETESLNPNENRLVSSEITLKRAEKEIEQLERKIARQTR